MAEFGPRIELILTLKKSPKRGETKTQKHLLFIDTLFIKTMFRKTELFVERFLFCKTMFVCSAGGSHFDASKEKGERESREVERGIEVAIERGRERERERERGGHRTGRRALSALGRGNRLDEERGMFFGEMKSQKCIALDI